MHKWHFDWESRWIFKYELKSYPQIKMIFTDFLKSFLSLLIGSKKKIMMEDYREEETYKIIGICMEVHRTLGSRLL